MSKRLNDARKAFAKKENKASKKAHSKASIQHSLHHPDEEVSTGKYIGDAVYGALDGIVTTFAVVSSVVGAELSLNIILIMGFANLLADGFSMAAGSYLSVKSEQDYHQLEYEREKWEMENYPKGEIEEIRQIYKKKGFKGKDLERAVKIITSNEEQWLETMMVEELGIITDDKNPLTTASITFFSFLICGFLPLLSFILIMFFPELKSSGFMISCIVTGITIFTVGSLRSLVLAKSWWRAGLEMLLIGGAAATVAYGIGAFLKGLAL